ncbi:MAG: DUF2442 domain-containing protein [Candidatus Caenarcaniphilales bacterium]|nr:DUF2442 domain-containing protein [Candidatus Caenarcaniphilales bacterium]
MSEQKDSSLIKLISVENLGSYKVKLTFNNGRTGIVDLTNKAGKSVFKEWEDENFFNNYTISADQRSLMWEKEIDLCVDSLYKDIFK